MAQIVSSMWQLIWMLRVNIITVLKYEKLREATFLVQYSSHLFQYLCHKLMGDEGGNDVTNNDW